MENKNSLNIPNKIINDNLNNNMESQNNIQKEPINIIIAELNELKLTNSKLEDEIALLKTSLKESNDKMEEMINNHNTDIESLKKKGENDLLLSNEKTKKIIDDLNNKHNRIINGINNRHNISIDELKKKISDIQNKNNSLNNTIEKISKENQIMKSEIASNNMKNKNDINKLNNRLNNLEKEKEKHKNEIRLVKSRDSAKYIIDFLYTILTKNINLSLKYENKVDIICENIKKESSPEQSKFVSNLCEFLNHLFQDKAKGDSSAHPNYFVFDIFNENKNVCNFFINFLEVKKYFNDFRALYFCNDENEKESRIKFIQQYCSQIDLFSILKEFASKIK